MTGTEQVDRQPLDERCDDGHRGAASSAGQSARRARVRPASTARAARGRRGICRRRIESPSRAPGQAASSAAPPSPVTVAWMALAAAAPAAASRPARRPPSSVLRTTTAVVRPGVATNTQREAEERGEERIGEHALSAAASSAGAQRQAMNAVAVSAPSIRLASVRCSTCAAGGSAGRQDDADGHLRRRARQRQVRPHDAARRRSTWRGPDAQPTGPTHRQAGERRQLAVGRVERPDRGQGLVARPDGRGRRRPARAPACRRRPAPASATMTAVVHQPTVRRDRGGAGVPGAASDSSSAASSSATMTSATSMCTVTIQAARSCATTRPPSQPWKPVSSTAATIGQRMRGSRRWCRQAETVGARIDEPDGHAEQPVQVLGPHQRRVELRRVEAGRQVGGRGRRNPRSEAARPVGTAQTGARRPHQAADGDQEIGDGGGGNRQALERGARTSRGAGDRTPRARTAGRARTTVRRPA